jgi:hypothetical protein
LSTAEPCSRRAELQRVPVLLLHEHPLASFTDIPASRQPLIASDREAIAEYAIQAIQAVFMLTVAPCL